MEDDSVDNLVVHQEREKKIDFLGFTRHQGSEFLFKVHDRHEFLLHG